MQTFKVAMPLVLVTLMSGLVGCATSASNTASKEECVTQKPVIGSRLARSTCKPAASADTKEVTAAATAQ